jgi:anti-anti-sigma regulatory factor
MAARRPREIVCDASALPPGAAAVEALALLQLGARRAGTQIRLSGASPELRHLIAFCGLSDVLGVEPEGQPEQREDRLGVEEERHLGDPPA